MNDSLANQIQKENNNFMLVYGGGDLNNQKQSCSPG